MFLGLWALGWVTSFDSFVFILQTLSATLQLYKTKEIKEKDKRQRIIKKKVQKPSITKKSESCRELSNVTYFYLFKTKYKNTTLELTLGFNFPVILARP